MGATTRVMVCMDGPCVPLSGRCEMRGSMWKSRIVWIEISDSASTLWRSQGQRTFLGCTGTAVSCPRRCCVCGNRPNTDRQLHRHFPVQGGGPTVAASDDCLFHSRNRVSARDPSPVPIERRVLRPFSMPSHQIGHFQAAGPRPCFAPGLPVAECRRYSSNSIPDSLRVRAGPRPVHGYRFGNFGTKFGTVRGVCCKFYFETK